MKKESKMRSFDRFGVIYEEESWSRYALKPRSPGLTKSVSFDTGGSSNCIKLTKSRSNVSHPLQVF